MLLFNSFDDFMFIETYSELTEVLIEDTCHFSK